MRWRVAIKCPSQKHRLQTALDSGHSKPTIVLGNQRPSPVAFWLRYKQQVLSHVGTAETLVGDPCTPAGPFRALLLRAALWAEKDAILEAMQEQPDWEDLPPGRWPGPVRQPQRGMFLLSPTQRVARRSKAAPTALAQPIQVKSPPPHVMRLEKKKKVTPFIPASPHLRYTPGHKRNVKIGVSSPLSLKTLSPDSHAQHGMDQGRSSRRMASAGADALSPLCFEKPCQGSFGRVQLLDLLPET